MQPRSGMHEPRTSFLRDDQGAAIASIEHRVVEHVAEEVRAIEIAASPTPKSRNGSSFRRGCRTSRAAHGIATSI